MFWQFAAPGWGQGQNQRTAENLKVQSIRHFHFINIELKLKSFPKLNKSHKVACLSMATKRAACAIMLNHTSHIFGAWKVANSRFTPLILLFTCNYYNPTYFCNRRSRPLLVSRNNAGLKTFPGRSTAMTRWIGSVERFLRTCNDEHLYNTKRVAHEHCYWGTVLNSSTACAIVCDYCLKWTICERCLNRQ